jgi:vacuolar-type H+-ATPase subunit I/STV1
VGKAQTVVDQARADTASGSGTPINLREAEIKLFEALQIEDIDQLVPEPQGPSPQEEALLGQIKHQQMIEDREMAVKEQKAALDEFKVELERLKEARDSALELSRLGLEADKDEADITRTYAEALAKLVKDAGLTYDAALSQVTRLEREKIEGDLNGTRQLPPTNGAPVGAMAQ